MLEVKPEFKRQWYLKQFELLTEMEYPETDQELLNIIDDKLYKFAEIYYCEPEKHEVLLNLNKLFQACRMNFKIINDLSDSSCETQLLSESLNFSKRVQERYEEIKRKKKEEEANASSANGKYVRNDYEKETEPEQVNEGVQKERNLTHKKPESSSEGISSSTTGLLEDEEEYLCEAAMGDSSLLRCASKKQYLKENLRNQLINLLSHIEILSKDLLSCRNYISDHRELSGDYFSGLSNAVMQLPHQHLASEQVGGGDPESSQLVKDRVSRDSEAQEYGDAIGLLADANAPCEFAALLQQRIECILQTVSTLKQAVGDATSSKATMVSQALSLDEAIITISNFVNSKQMEIEILVAHNQGMQQELEKQKQEYQIREGAMRAEIEELKEELSVAQESARKLPESDKQVEVDQEMYEGKENSKPDDHEELEPNSELKVDWRETEYEFPGTIQAFDSTLRQLEAEEQDSLVSVSQSGIPAVATHNNQTGTLPGDLPMRSGDGECAQPAADEHSDVATSASALQRNSFIYQLLLGYQELKALISGSSDDGGVEQCIAHCAEAAGILHREMDEECLYTEEMLTRLLQRHEDEVLSLKAAYAENLVHLDDENYGLTQTIKQEEQQLRGFKHTEQENIEIKIENDELQEKCAELSATNLILYDQINEYERATSQIGLKQTAKYELLLQNYEHLCKGEEGAAVQAADAIMELLALQNDGQTAELIAGLRRGVGALLRYSGQVNMRRTVVSDLCDVVGGAERQQILLAALSQSSEEQAAALGELAQRIDALQERQIELYVESDDEYGEVKRESQQLIRDLLNSSLISQLGKLYSLVEEGIEQSSNNSPEQIISELIQYAAANDDDNEIEMERKDQLLIELDGEIEQLCGRLGELEAEKANLLAENQRLRQEMEAAQTHIE